MIVGVLDSPGAFVFVVRQRAIHQDGKLPAAAYSRTAGVFWVIGVLFLAMLVAVMAPFWSALRDK
jgi:hypothetical protein